MAKITDPDQLNQATEIVISTGAKTIQLLIAGNLNDTAPGKTSGVTLQAVYSFLKEEWKTDATLNKLRFPFEAITEVKMDFINTWDWADAQTRDLVRDGGWSLRDTGGVSQEEYMNVQSLGGAFAGATDLAYYHGTQGFTTVATLLDKADEVNEPVKTYGDATHGNFDDRDFFKIFLREQGKLYAGGTDLILDQTLTALDYTVYKIPLVNATDIKIVATDITIDTTTPYVGTSDGNGTDGSVTAASATFNSASITFASGDVGKVITIATGTNLGKYKIVTFTDTSNVDVDRQFEATEASITYDRRPLGMSIDYLDGSLFEDWANSQVYTANQVVRDPIRQSAGSANGTWWITPAGGTASGTGTADDTGVTDWASYSGEEQIGDEWYAFNRVIDANASTIEKMYEFCQRQLRATGTNQVKESGYADINDDVAGDANGVQRGEIAVQLCSFLGDTLQTNKGTVIRNFDTNDTNDIEMFDITEGTGASFGLNADLLPNTTSSRVFPFVAAGTIVFNQILIDDTAAEFTMYFLNDDPPGDNTGADFNTTSAVKVNDNGGSAIEAASISGNVAFDYDYDGNVQRGSGSAGTDVPVVIVAMGHGGAQWVEAQFTITRATGLSFPVNSAQERNYLNA